MIKVVKNSPQQFRKAIQTIYKDGEVIGEFVVGDLSKVVSIKLKTTHTAHTMVEILSFVQRVAPMSYKVCLEYEELSPQEYDPYAFYHG